MGYILAHVRRRESGAADPEERRSLISEHDSSTRTPSDRVLYAEGFRRLGRVTQVATGTPAMGMHDRLTHSLKVEQVGLSIVSRLREMDPEGSGRVGRGAVATAKEFG